MMRLSQSSCAVRLCPLLLHIFRVHQLIYVKPVAGDEEAEVSIKDAAEAVKKAMDCDGEIVVSFHSAT